MTCLYNDLDRIELIVELVRKLKFAYANSLGLDSIEFLDNDPVSFDRWLDDLGELILTNEGEKNEYQNRNFGRLQN